MNRNRWLAKGAGVALLCAVLQAAPVAAQEPQGFVALEGVQAQAMTLAEMEAVAGELNAYDIAAALYAQAANLAKFPRLQAAVTKLADYYFSNATAINDFFARLGILTPCKAGCP